MNIVENNIEEIFINTFKPHKLSLDNKDICECSLETTKTAKELVFCSKNENYLSLVS
jgi:hypothetical protein